MLPNDPVMLLSVLNTRLRDLCPSLDALCDAEDADRSDLCERLAQISYRYNPDTNRFEQM